MDPPGVVFVGRERRRRLGFDVVIPPGEGVGHNVVNSSYVLQAEIVLLQVLRPANQPSLPMKQWNPREGFEATKP